MKQLIFLIILVFISKTSCNKKSFRNNEITADKKSNVININLKKTLDSIKSSDTYENPKNWEARGLMPSSQPIILKLRKATDDFLTKLEKIEVTNESYEIKLNQVENIVNQLPWDEFDTEEKEFLADTLAPAIKAAGYDPSLIF